MDVLTKNHRILTSLDGSSNRNTPERCPRPLYSQENHSIPQEYQGEYLNDIKVEVIEEDEETYVRGDQQFRKEEEIPTDISTDGSSNRDTPERCPRPLYSQDGTEEDHSIPQEYQGEDLTYIKIEDMEGEEEMYVIRAQQYKDGDIHTDVSTRREATLQHRRPQMRRHHESPSTLGTAARQPGRSSQAILATQQAAARHSNHILGKKRRPNFSYQEVDILVNNVVDMLMTASSSLTSAGKLAIWQQITHNVNTMAPITRSVEEVKKRWQDFKRRLKEKLREHHRQVRVNGLGPTAHLLLTPLEQRAMVCIHQEQIQGLDGGDTVRPLSALHQSIAEDIEDQQQSPRSPRLDPQSPSPPPPLSLPPLPLPPLPLPPLPESPAATLAETSSRSQILQELQSDRAAALEYYDRLMEIQRQQLTLQERQAEALEGVGATLSRLATAQERLATAQERQNIIMEGMVSVFKRMTGLSMPTLYGLGGASAAGEPEPQEPPAPSPPAASVARLTRRQERPQEPTTPASEGKRLKRGKK